MGVFAAAGSVVEWFIPVVDGYTMGLNIKNRETERLIKQLADMTGENMTLAVTNAVRERLDKIAQSRRESLAERLVAIGKDCAAHLKKPYRTIDHAELLYDDRGLPK
jgi:antitoxin VapB